MKRVFRSRHRNLVLGVLCLLVATLFALFAADVASWRSTVARDDVRFRALPTHNDLWRPSTRLPFDPAGAVIGTGSTVAWRRALQSFWYARIGSDPERPMDAPALRAVAQNALLGQLASAPTSAQRSAAANLLGVLVITTPSEREQDVLAQLLKRAADYFQVAIDLDASNANAKQNLELVLRIKKPGRGRIGKDARSGYGFGRGEGSTDRGNGY